MTPDDPGIWRELLAGAMAGAMAALSGAVAWVWKRVDNSASKADLADALRALEKSTDQWRTTTALLFANAESDRLQWHKDFTAMQDKIHAVHVEVLENCAAIRREK